MQFSPYENREFITSGTHGTGFDFGMKVGRYHVLYSIKAGIIMSNTIYLVNPMQNENNAYMIQKIDSGAKTVLKNVILAIW